MTRTWQVALSALLCVTGTLEARNVLLFTVDSCRADRFGIYGYAGSTTPNIDSWARSGTVFVNAYSTSAWTAPGLVSLLSGLYPPTHGVNNRDNSGPPRLQTLPKILKKHGYRVPNLNFFTFAPYYKRLGLPKIQRKYFGEKPGQELLSWLEDNTGTAEERPFFIWYHTTIVHQPYNPPPLDLPAPREELEKSAGIKAVLNGAIVPVGSVRFSPEDKPILDQLYDAEIRRMDRLFKSALDVLAAKDLLDETLVVLTADHGEELLDHGFVGHASTSLQAKLYQEVVRIPLIFSWPDRVPAGRRVTQPVSQVDVLPTILSLLQIEPPSHLHGTSLFSSLSDERALFFESVISGNQTTREHQDIWVRGILKGHFKYISTDELYDVSTDPREQKNLVDLKPALVQQLRGELEEWLAQTQAQHKTRYRPQPEVVSTNRTEKCPTIQTPENHSLLEYDQHTGAILIDWSGSKEMSYLIEYDIGTGNHHVAGIFEVTGNHQLLGPLSKELWQNLRAWNPFKIRVSPKSSHPCWSEWIVFEF